jgi:NADH-quinone oxidoreductase subunit N
VIPAPELELRAAGPLLAVAIGALVVLVAELALGGRPDVSRPRVGAILAFVSSLFLGVVILLAVQGFASGEVVEFNPARPMMQLDRLANFAIAVVALGALLSCWLSITYLEELRINHGEYYALVLLATSGMILLVSAVDLITVFLGIEALSIPIYVLAGFDRRHLRSNESALKYFLVGSFASAIMLYGMAFLYGATGSTHFGAIRAGLDPESPLAMAGLGLVLVGFTFKISSVPFHQWTPDVYEGAPTSVTAYMSVTVKAAAFAALLRIVAEAFLPAAAPLEGVLWVLAALTMVVGNVMAVIQDNVKRLLAYSSVAHAGYLLIGFVAATPRAASAVLFYLLVYVFMNLGAFGVIVALAHRGRDAERMDDFAGLAHTRPGLAALMTLFMVSLAGIPGTAGFIAKFQLFAAAVEADQVPLVILAVLASLVSIYYYLRLPVLMYMREPGAVPPRGRLDLGEGVALGLCAFGVLALGLFPGGIESGPLSWLPPALDWVRLAVAG